MGKTQSLKSFLQREVLRKKIKEPSPSCKTDTSAFDKLDRRAQLKKKLLLLISDNIPSNDSMNNEITNGNTSAVDGGDTETLFTLFNEREEETETKDDRLSCFLAEDRKEKNPEKEVEYASSKHRELELLRDELANLIAFEETLDGQEKLALRKEREKLSADITRLQGEVDRIDKDRRTAKSDASLPPPIDPSDMKRLQNTVRRIKNARAGTERAKRPQKRTREDDDLDLDGEERLRLGKRLKKPTLARTGAWKKPVGTFFCARAGGTSNISEMQKNLALKKEVAERERREAVEAMDRMISETVGEDGEL